MGNAVVIDQPVGGPAAWQGPEVRDDGSWLHHLSEAQVQEHKRHLLRLWLTLHRNAEDGRGRGGIPATRPASTGGRRA